MASCNCLYGILLLVLIQCSQTVLAQCTFDSTLEGTTWHDSTRGDVTFSGSTMSTWTHSGASVLEFPSWTCVNYTVNSYLVLRTTTTVLLSSGTSAYAYVCMKLTPISAYSFRYYLQNIQQPDLAYERVKISSLTTLIQTDVCNEGITVPAVEYHVLVRSGFEANAAIRCPDSLLFSADYVYYGSDGTTACDTTADNWNVCIDKSRMTFNLNTCSQQVAFSSGGVLWCVAHVGSTYDYTLVYNNDTTVDGSTTERFTCIASEGSQTYASFTARNCSVNLTPYTFDKEPANLNDIGHRVVIGTKYETCEDDDGLTAGEIAAIVLSVLYVLYMWGLTVTIIVIVIVIMVFQFIVIMLELTGNLTTARKSPTLSYIDIPEPDKEWSPSNKGDIQAVTPSDVDLKKGDNLTRNGTLPPISEIYLDSRAKGTLTDRPKVINETETSDLKGKNGTVKLINETKTNDLKEKNGLPAIHKPSVKPKKMLTVR